MFAAAMLTAVLVVGSDRRFLAAPGFERTDPHRRREGCAHEKDLLVQRPINRHKNTQKRSHK